MIAIVDPGRRAAPAPSSAIAEHDHGDAGDRLAGLDRGCVVQRILHGVLSCGSVGDGLRARSRATRSASRTSATSSTFPVPCLEHLVDGLGDRRARGSGPARNASTATSLAPLSVAGRPAAGPTGRVGEAQAREGLEVGRLEGERAERRPVDRRRTAGRGGAGAPRARPIGRRMSGIDSWAMVAPSVNSTMPWTTDCGCTTTSIRSKLDAEQLVGLDHLEALVHQRRRVDRDLRPHGPGRVRERVGDGDVGQLGPASGRGTARRSR